MTKTDTGPAQTNRSRDGGASGMPLLAVASPSPSVAQSSRYVGGLEPLQDEALGLVCRCTSLSHQVVAQAAFTP